MVKMQKPRKRLVKAKLKEDKLLVFTAKAQRFAQRNRKTFVFGAIGVILIAAVIGLYIYSHRTAENSASFIELMARDAYSRGELDETLGYTANILKDFSGTSAAATALLLEGRVHEQRGEYEQAIEAFEQLISKHGDQPYLGFAACNALGTIYFGMQDYEIAAKYYQKAANNYPGHYNSAVALVDAGESYEKASRYEEAKNVYQKVLTAYGKSRSADKARTNLTKLEFTE